MNAHETDLGRLLHAFFCERLIQQRHASDSTIASYRDTFRLLLQFAAGRLGKPVSALCLADINAGLVLAFLDHLEQQRHNCVRSRNARLAAIHSFLHYVAWQEPTSLPHIQHALAIPMKRYNRPVVGFLSREEIDAILAAPDTSAWSGQRDLVLLTILYNTGARVSEVIGLRNADLIAPAGNAVLLHGKGRKERVVPLWKRSSTLLRRWQEQSGATAQSAICPNRFGQPMTRSGVTYRLKLAVEKARQRCPSLLGKTISPHTIRHTTAMHLLQAGVDLAVIALWLGHESITTTHQYLDADLRMKQNALAAIQAPQMTEEHVAPPADLLAFLDSL